MGLSEIRDLVSSVFIMLNQKKYILFRIEFLVVLITVLFFVMFIMDNFRRHIHNATMKAIFTLVDTVSDSIVIYLLGAMQTAPFKNGLFPVWALVLVNFRYSTDFISGYGVPDLRGRRFTEWRNVVKLLGSAFLNWSRGSQFALPLWSLWALQILRSSYRFQSRSLALNSSWLGGSSELISEYMRDASNWKPDECNPGTMEGYKYLVYGEKVKLQKPRYVLHIKNISTSQQRRRRSKPGKHPTTTGSKKITRSTLITLDKICGCRRHLLHPCDNIPSPNNSGNIIQGKDQKDLSLAFALSRLIRCRLEDVRLPRDTFRVNKILVKTRIIDEKDVNRAFGIMEQQLAFLNDYFNTRYPMVFWFGLTSLFWSLLASVVTFGVVCWLSVDIRKIYKPPEGELVHLKQGVNVDMIITWVFMFFMMFKEIWEMVIYLLSDWTRLLLVCMYARWDDEYTRNHCMENLILCCFKSNIIAKRWHGHIDQYVFLESYDDRPKIWNLIHTISTGMVPKKDNGAKLSNAIDIPECVKHAILEKLNSMDLTAGYLPKVVNSLRDDKWKSYQWACFELETCTHTILAWHIATSLCEIKLAQGHGVNLSKHGFLCNLLSCFTNCFCSNMYLMDEKKLPGKLQERYIIANSLSRYCAYLLVSKPDLIPDSFFVPNMIFRETVTLAHDDILKGCESLQERYDKLMPKENNNTQNVREENINVDVLRQGAKLADKLMKEENEDCWEILSGVWTELLIHLAPSWNASAHKKYLESGGEFITHIWAVLWHCGIEKSILWPVEDVPLNNAPGATQNNNAENSKVQPVNEMSQAARDKQQMPATTTPNGGHRSCLANGKGNVVRKMKNLGNTCYFNAVLQSLLALNELRVRMLEQDPPPERVLHWELKKLYMDTINCEENTVEPKDLFQLMCSRHEDINQGDTADSNHALHSLLDDLINEEPEGMDLPSTVKSLFNGQVVKSVSSKQCEHRSDTTEALVLSLAIPSKKPVSIQDCLDLYTIGEVDDWECNDCSDAAANASSSQTDKTVDNDQTEKLNSAHQKEHFSHSAKKISTPDQDKGKLPFLDGNSDQMDKCHDKPEEGKKIRRVATIRYHIKKAPPILTIQLKRFEYVHDDGSGKLEEHVSFQETLDLTKYMDTDKDTRCVGNEEYKYCLVAVIVHKGRSLDDGHNFSYVRAGRNDGQNRKSSDTPSWFLANDEEVEEVSLEKVLECEAYILFYERVQQSKEKHGRAKWIRMGDILKNVRCLAQKKYLLNKECQTPND
uniref:USP domain-containing protein n=1 Tax=Oryza nivara TaxID=4536 RepID=A0A0E0J4C6_ORYNI